MSASKEIAQALIEILRLQLVIAGSMFTLNQRVHKLEETALQLLSTQPEVMNTFRESVAHDFEVADKLEKETREQIKAALEAIEGVSRG
jgi:hypothetical protein